MVELFEELLTLLGIAAGLLIECVVLFGQGAELLRRIAERAFGPVHPQAGFDPCGQLGDVERLCHVIVRSGVEGPDDVVRRRAGRDHDHGEELIVSLLDLATDVPPIAPGKHRVEEDEVCLRQMGEDLFAASDADDAEALRLQ